MRHRRPSPLTVLAPLVAFAALFALSTPSAAQVAPRITLVHGIPDLVADVVVADEVAIADFEFGDVEDLSGLAGTTLSDVAVRVAGTDEVALAVGDLSLPSTGSVTALAHLNADGAPTVTVFENDLSTIPAGQGRVVLRHAAAAPPVDISVDGTNAFSDIGNGDEAMTDLPDGSVTAAATAVGDGAVVLPESEIAVTAGAVSVFYVVGSLDDDSVSVISDVIDGLAAAPTEVRTGTSPIDAPNGSTDLTWLTVAVLAGAGAVFSARRLALR